MISIIGNIDKLYKYNYENNKYKYMTDKQLINIANTIIENIKRTGIKQIIVSECGAYPLVYICQKIAKKENINLDWFFFKTPRKQNVKIRNVLLYHLTDSEKQEKIGYYDNDKKTLTREEMINKILCEKTLSDIITLNEKITPELAIKSIAKINNMDSFNKIYDILKGTKIYKVFNQQFIFFDEYVHIGTILYNFNIYASMISKNPNYKLGAYCTYVSNIKKYDEIAFSLYGLDNLEKCFLDGLYPFEDRIDIIGYFYYINEDEYKKIQLSTLKEEFITKNNNKEELNIFISKLKNEIKVYNLLEKLKKHISEKKVSENISESDILRYMFKELEFLNSGNSKYYQFLDEIFETYAPMWIPLPPTFHWSYWEGFEINKTEITKILANYFNEYEKIRSHIFNEIIEIFNNKQRQWKEKINKLL